LTTAEQTSPDSDLLAVDEGLTPEELAFRARVREGLAELTAADVAEWYENAEAPAELMPALGRAGLLCTQVDGHGQTARSAVEQGILSSELERVDSGIRSMVAVHGNLSAHAIWLHGSDEQKDEWLPGMVAGERVGAFCLTEPNVGSDPSSMETTARRRGEDWVLNGAKAWVTNGPVASHAVVWAMTEEGVRGFIVPTDSRGLGIETVTGKLSLRISKTGALTFDDVVVPEGNRLPQAEGLGAPFKCLSEARYGIAWGTAGLARACLEEAIRYATERRQFGRPIGSFQLTQSKLAEMSVDVGYASLLAVHLGRIKEERGLTPAQISTGKLGNTRIAVRTARRARRILGANGISGSFPLMRHMANLETVVTYEGTEEVHMLVLGGTLTGIEPAFR